MARTARNNWPYPNQDNDAWYDTFKALVNAMDASFFTTREDKNFVLFGGGSVSFNATTGVLSWTSPFEAVSATSGFHWYIPAPATGGSVTLQDGEFFFVELTRNPQSSVAVVARVGSQINPNDNSLVIAQRIGSVVVFRNGAVVASGQTIILFGPRVMTQVYEIVGLAGKQETQLSSWQGVGALRFVPTDFYPGGLGITREVRFEAWLETTDDVTPLPAQVRLYDLTNGAPITASVLSSSSLTTARQVSGILVVGTDIPNATTDFEVQIRLDDTAGSPTPSDQISCKKAALRITWS
jgi:hypothetical protein